MTPNSLKKRFYVWCWRLAYDLEEARQRSAAAGHLWAQAWACVMLSILRAWR